MNPFFWSNAFTFFPFDVKLEINCKNIIFVQFDG